MSGNSSDLGYVPRVREIETSRAEAKELSSQIFDAIGLKGQISQPGPGVSRCDKDPKVLYKIRHPWSLWGVPEADMEKAMERLNDELPKRGWKVTSYGRDSSRAKNLEIIADSKKFDFSANITFMDKRNPSQEAPADLSKTSGIVVDVVSACFRVPDGKVVDAY
ncbi:hypothetical protein ACFYZH_22925 [Streptomyces abikoensis]|uniref:hypothetical protein n=1 Tax=Streptomyces abikoensis TaxID=97398 RepID=UPI0036AA22C5